MKLSKPHDDKPRFEIPGRHSIVVASAIFALLIFAGLLSRRPVPLAHQPTPPPVSQDGPTPAPTPIVTPEPSPPPEAGCPDGCQSSKPGCDIKGNISLDDGERIYHLPGQVYYKKTKISPEKGERWFCTEEEARAAGWRKSKV